MKLLVLAIAIAQFGAVQFFYLGWDNHSIVSGVSMALLELGLLVPAIDFVVGYRERRQARHDHQQYLDHVQQDFGEAVFFRMEEVFIDLMGNLDRQFEIGRVGRGVTISQTEWETVFPEYERWLERTVRDVDRYVSVHLPMAVQLKDFDLYNRIVWLNDIVVRLAHEFSASRFKKARSVKAKAQQKEQLGDLVGVLAEFAKWLREEADAQTLEDAELDNAIHSLFRKFAPLISNKEMVVWYKGLAWDDSRFD